MRLEGRKKREETYLVQINIFQNHHRITISFSKQPLQMQKAPNSTKDPLETIFRRALWRLLHLTVGTGLLLDYLTDNEPYSTIIRLTFRANSPNLSNCLL